MKLFSLMFAFLFLLVVSCGYSGSQRDVAEQYKQIILLISQENWASVFNLFTADTQTFLNEFAEGLSSAGLHGYSSGVDLLSETAEAAGLHNLSAEVSVILEEEGDCYLTVSSVSGSKSYIFKQEHGVWKLELEQHFKATYQTALEGSGILIEDIIAFAGVNTETAPANTGAE